MSQTYEELKQSLSEEQWTKLLELVEKRVSVEDYFTISFQLLFYGEIKHPRLNEVFRDCVIQLSIKETYKLHARKLSPELEKKQSENRLERR